MPIILPSGLLIPNTSVILTFAKESFLIYDGEEISRDNHLRSVDASLSVMMNSRLSGNTGLEILKRKEIINNVLMRIPNNIDLSEIENIDNIAESLKDIINVFCETKRVGMSVATKILHKKRPNLIPMFDKVLQDYYRYGYPYRIRGRTVGDKFIGFLRYFHQDLRTVSQELNRIVDALQNQNTPFTKVRILEAFIWIYKEKTQRYLNMKR